MNEESKLLFEEKRESRTASATVYVFGRRDDEEILIKYRLFLLCGDSFSGELRINAKRFLKELESYMRNPEKGMTIEKTQEDEGYRISGKGKELLLSHWYGVQPYGETIEAKFSIKNTKGLHQALKKFFPEL